MYRTIMAGFILATLFCSGCSIVNPKNTPLFNASEEYLVPKNQPQRTLAYTAVLPVSLSALAIDGLIAYPARQFEPAFKESNERIWNITADQWRESYFSASASMLGRAVWYPVYFTGIWLRKSFFEDASLPVVNAAMPSAATTQPQETPPARVTEVPVAAGSVPAPQ